MTKLGHCNIKIFIRHIIKLQKNDVLWLRHVTNSWPRSFQKNTTYSIVNTTTGAIIWILLVNTVNMTPFEGTMRSINTPCSHCVRLTDTHWLLWLTLSVPVQGVRVREALARTTEEGLCQRGVEGRRISTRVWNLWNLLNTHKPAGEKGLVKCAYLCFCSIEQITCWQQIITV